MLVANKIKNNSWFIAFAIACVAAILYLPFLGSTHLFDWDEINFAECAREMILTNNYAQPQINFIPFYEKPPLFIWFQVLSMKAFGINEYAARLPDAICGIITLVTVFFVGKRITQSSRFGILWAVCFGASLLPHLYFKSGIIDPWFNLFIFLALTFLAKTFNQLSKGKNIKHIFAASIFGGLALLTKGPVALLMIGMAYSVTFLLLNYKKRFISILIDYLKIFLPFCLLSIGVACLWFGDDLINHSGNFTSKFINYNLRLAETQDAGHGGFIGYHVVVLLIGCFPAVAFALPELLKVKSENLKVKNIDDKFSLFTFHFSLLMRSLFYVTLIVFSLVQSKIVHYSSLCYFPLTFLAAMHLERVLNKLAPNDVSTSESAEHKNVISIFSIVVLLFVGFIWAALLIALPIAGQNIESLKPLFNKDPFALANLNAKVTWDNWEIGFGIEFLVLFIFGVFNYTIQKVKLGLILIFSATFFLAQSVIYHFVPKVEKYSQGAAIAFYEQHRNLNAVMHTANFKSYAQYFYSGKKPVNYINYNIETLDSFFIAKGTYQRDSSFQKIGEKNGFVFYKKRRN